MFFIKGEHINSLSKIENSYAILDCQGKDNFDLDEFIMIMWMILLDNFIFYGYIFKQFEILVQMAAENCRSLINGEKKNKEARKISHSISKRNSLLLQVTTRCLHQGNDFRKLKY